MKRILSYLLISVLIFGILFVFSSCDNSEKSDSSKAQFSVSSKNRDESGDENVKGDDEGESSVPKADATIGIFTGFTVPDIIEDEWFEGYSALEFSNAQGVVEALKSGKIRFALMDRSAANLLARGDGIKVIKTPLYTDYFTIVIDKSQPELKDAINSILSEKAGEIEDIIAKYLNGEEIMGVESALMDLSQKDKQLVVSTTANYAPFEYRIGERFAGIDIEIIALIANELGLELVIQDMDFTSVLIAVKSNYADVAIATLVQNSFREEYASLTTPYYDISLSLVVLEEDTAFDDCVTSDEILEKIAELK